MGKRKSITGLKTRKPRKLVAGIHSPVRHAVHLDRQPSPFEDELQGPAPRQLFHLKHATRAYQGPQMKRPAGMKARVEHVSQRTIETKWGTLDDSATKAVQQLMQATHVPVLANFGSERPKEDAQALLQTVRTMLYKRLPKTPFPPNTSETDFDYEQLARMNHDMQQQIRDVKESIAQMKEMLNDQRSALEDEEHQIEDLTGIVQKEEAARAGAHYLSPSSPGQSFGDTPDKINLIERHEL